MNERTTAARGEPVLQRQCSCGGHAGGECAECKKKRQRLDRTRERDVAGPAASTLAPPSVRRVLRGAGAPLPPPVRQPMESGFGHDFSSVRVHTGLQAAASAAEVGAAAYTVGRHIAFADGRWAPQSAAGTKLVAHELAHVLQQDGAAAPGAQIEIGAPDAPQEREAERWAETVTAGASLGAAAGGEPATLRRDPPDGGEAKAKEKEKEKEKPKGNWAGKSIPQKEKEGLAVGLFQDIGVQSINSFGSVKDAKFLLHDTSGASSRSTIEAKAKDARGPLGSGPNVFVPPTGLEILQRPDSFDPSRPTTTEFEKGTDILDEPGRDTQLRKAWKAATSGAQDAAADASLSGISTMNPKEILDEKVAAKKQLSATNGKIFTTAHWTVAELCKQVKSKGAKAVAVAGKDAELQAACDIIGPVLAQRAARAAATVSVELVQVGAKKGGNQNTCNPKNPDALPLPNPPYSADQYWNTTLMYVRAALAAGVWPTTTTHFVEDSFAGGHCDPRCFDLQSFYDTIAGLIGHGKGSTYGVTPSYGLKSGTNSVWWDDTVCHGAHP